jgi:SAM-dependent methyltransferase
VDAQAFHDFEHEGWESIPDAYHQAFAALTSQSVAPLLDAAEVAKGSRVLDVATGPGYVAAAAAKRGAKVTGVDFSRTMVERARRDYPALESAEGDAEALAFADASFDAVLMNYGLLHLARPDQALAEARRVLRPGGRLAVTVWAPPERTIGFGIVLDAIREHGRMDAAVPSGPPFFRFGDLPEARRSLEAAGLAQVGSREIAQVWRLPDANTLFAWMCTSTVRTGALLRAQSHAALAAIGKAVTDRAGVYRNGDTIELPMPAVLSFGARER